MVAGLVTEQYWVLALPILVAIALLAIYRLDTFVYIIAFLTPLSINLTDIGMGYGISLPAEPLLAGMMLIFFLKIAYEGGFDKKIIKHPVSIAPVFIPGLDAHYQYYAVVCRWFRLNIFWRSYGLFR